MTHSLASIPNLLPLDSLQWQAGSCWSQCWRLRGCCPRIVPRTHSEIACHAPSAAPPPPALAFPGIAPDVLFQSAEDEVSGVLKMTVHVAEMPLCGFAWNASVPYHQCVPLGSGQTCMCSDKREMQAKFKNMKKMHFSVEKFIAIQLQRFLNGLLPVAIRYL